MPANSDPDAALMLQVKRGDRAAFTLLVEKYKQPVVNLIARTLRDETEAEDLAQNVFVQIYKSAHRYRTSAKFSTWLFTIARNICLNEIRRRSRHPAESLDAPHPELADQPLHQFEDL
ncbi:MAG TPA: sigma-70 family RNA polymerase sigma factor, partial [Verrucomicrobiae bacterium]|nr:sigma-70 family RNA polymerase sigma factor [Verrucomicrobiae bacterium]